MNYNFRDPDDYFSDTEDFWDSMIDTRLPVIDSGCDLLEPYNDQHTEEIENTCFDWYEQLVEETNRFHEENKPNRTSMRFGTEVSKSKDARSEIDTFGPVGDSRADRPINYRQYGLSFAELFNDMAKGIDRGCPITKSPQELKARDSNLENKPDVTSMTFGTSFSEVEGQKPEENQAMPPLSLGSWLSPISTLQEFGFGPDLKENGWVHDEDKGPPDYWCSPYWCGGLNSVAQSIYSRLLKPAASILTHEENFFRYQWKRNSQRIRCALLRGSSS